MKRGKSDDVMTIPLTRDSLDRKGEGKTAFDEQLNSVEKVSFDFFEGNRETYISLFWEYVILDYCGDRIFGAGPSSNWPRSKLKV